MKRQYFRTFVSGEARVSISNGKPSKDSFAFDSDMLTKLTGNKEVDELINSISDIVGNLDKKLNAIKDRLDECEDEQNQLSDCETLDISGNGLRILSKKEIKIGEVVFLSLDLFGYPNPRFEVYGKVVRSTSQPTIAGEIYYAGIEFINLEDKKREQLINFTFQQQRKYIRAFTDATDKILKETKPGLIIAGEYNE